MVPSAGLIATLNTSCSGSGTSSKLSPPSALRFSPPPRHPTYTVSPSSARHCAPEPCSRVCAPTLTNASPVVANSSIRSVVSREDASLALVDGIVVDAGVPTAHVALFVELPMLVAVAAPPLAAGVVRLVLESHRDPVIGEAPQLLAQLIVELALPLPSQEVHDRLTALEELVAIAPLGVLRVGGGNALGITRVPGVLRRSDLLTRGLLGEGRDRRSVGHGAQPTR